MVEKQALGDLELDALDLADVISDQVRRLGPNSRTKKAIQIFGHVGHQTQVSQFAAGEGLQSKRVPIKQRSLTDMFIETFWSLGESAVSSLMIWTFSFFRHIWK